ncbi:hypothetical protein SH467x_004150 [Pirellulaceae bacterium SH467]
MRILPPLNRPAPLFFGLYLLGTLLLPVGTFDRYRGRSDDWVYVLGTGLSFETPWNRGVILGLSAIIASLFVGAIRIGNRSQPTTLENNRPATQCVLCLWDLCIVGWIAVPTVAGLFNPSPIADDLWQAVYLAIVWGGPYLAARVTVRSLEDAKNCLWLIVFVGLLSALPAVIELGFGRFVYASLYGYHPNESIGEFKFFGTRPLLCFEDPNQIAMWWFTVAMAASLVVPTWWLNTREVRLKWAAVSLPFLFQGVGASLLTIVGVLASLMRRTGHWRTVLITLALTTSLAFVARGPLLRLGRDLAQKAGIEEPMKSLLRDNSIGSLAWRVVREEEGSRTLESNLLFGHGTVLFWQGDVGKYRPWGFISLVNGAYGFFGAAVVMLWFLIPPAAYWISRKSRTVSSARYRIGYGLAVMWGLHGVDAVVNPAFFLPTVFLFGLIPSLHSE